jgi:prophage DNA circulation protein
MRLLPASYASVRFHVEQQSRSGGRRVVLHEYPKRDLPFAEDMGRQAWRYQLNGYLIGPNYHITKRALMKALDNSAGGTLIDPYLAEPLMCICERYSVSETRERGGYCVFEMAFVELGASGNTVEQVDSRSQTENKAAEVGASAAANVDVPLPDPNVGAFGLAGPR